MSLFSRRSSSSDVTCPVEGSTQGGVPIAGSLTLQHIMLICGGACTALTLLFSLSLILKHLARYSNPLEQRQIVRLVFTPVVFAVTNLLGIAFYSASVYITPVADLYEAFALAALLMLYVFYVAPDRSQHDQFFAMTQNRSRKGEVTPGGSFQWFSYIWIVVFAYPVVKTILFIAQEASQATGRYCYTSNNVHFGHIWITIISSIAVAIAVMAILRFYARFKSEMKALKPFTKLVSFKAIVFTNFIQTLVFSFLNSGGHLKGNTKVTHNDLWLGIPSLLMCVEQVIFSAFFHYSYRTRQYNPSIQQGGHAVGFFGAAADAFNPADYFWGLVRAVGLFTSVKGRSQDGYLSQAPKGALGAVGDPRMDYQGAQKPNVNHMPQQEYPQQQAYSSVQQNYAPPSHHGHGRGRGRGRH